VVPPRSNAFRIEELSRAEIFQFAQAQVKKRGMDDGALEIVAQLPAVLPDDHHDLSLRGVLRVLDDLEALSEIRDAAVVMIHASEACIVRSLSISFHPQV